MLLVRILAVQLRRHVILNRSNGEFIPLSGVGSADANTLIMRARNIQEKLFDMVQVRLGQRDLFFTTIFQQGHENFRLTLL